jgi:hypothetical protein
MIQFYASYRDIMWYTFLLYRSSMLDLVFDDINNVGNLDKINTLNIPHLQSNPNRICRMLFSKSI